MHESDAHLIERIRESDREAFRLLFEKYQPILFRNVLHSLRDVDTTHDIVQETFLRIWQRRLSLQPHLSFLAFLFRISSNLVRDYIKHQRVRNRLDVQVQEFYSQAGDNPEVSAQLRMFEDKLSDVVRMKLPHKCRQVFLLSRMEEMSNAEISAHLGVSVKTVENQITRALKILRRHLLAYTKGR